MQKRNMVRLSSLRHFYSTLTLFLLVIFATLTPLSSPVAAAASPLYDWSTISSLAKNSWSALGMSGDGSTLLAGSYGSPGESQGYLYLSTDHGATWSKTANNEMGTWPGAAVSSDGTTLVAVQNSAGNWGPGDMYISHNGGATWTTASSISAGKWIAVAISDNGHVITAIQNNDSGGNGDGQIYTSTDSGATWTTAPHTARWTNIALSADGSTIIAAPSYAPNYDPDYLYLSHDYGATWSQVTNVTTRSDAYWGGVAVSSDGKTIVANAGNEGGSYDIGSIYISHDSGATWIRTSAAAAQYSTISISGNGQIILAGEWALDNYSTQPGISLLSIDGGTTWSPVPITPNQNFLASAVSRDGSTLALNTYTEGGDSSTYGNIYLGNLVPPPAQPVVDPIHAGDTTLAGTASPGTTITAHFVGGMSASAIANSLGKFSITVPSSINLRENDIVTFDATSAAGATSEPLENTVQLVPPGASTNSTPKTLPSNNPPSSPRRLAPTGDAFWLAVAASTTLSGLGLSCLILVKRSAQ